ncbi:hypothetical protein ACFYNM_30020 [Streptomyces spororaveus]|uniref:hypothetical protein n=1 Tax=Streptomyces spororaveus TaxID=284039 RepID=UPI0036CDEFAD
MPNRWVAGPAPAPAPLPVRPGPHLRRPHRACACEYGCEAGLDVPRDLDLGNRSRALQQLKVQPAAHSQMVAMVREALPEREAGLLIGSRQSPLLAARMQTIGERDGTIAVARHLDRLATDTSWQQATGTALGRSARGCDPHPSDHPARRPGHYSAPGLPDGSPLPLHHPRRGPRHAGPGRRRGPRPPPTGRPGQGSGTGTVTRYPDSTGTAQPLQAAPGVVLGGPGRDVPACRGYAVSGTSRSVSGTLTPGCRPWMCAHPLGGGQERLAVQDQVAHPVR